MPAIAIARCGPDCHFMFVYDEMAREVFRDPFAIEWEDVEQDPNEERYGVIGMVESRLLFVGYTMRGEKIRIITARKAEPYERRRYHEENREA
jgi:uncharacterized protein